MKNINYTKIQKDLDENGYVVLENFLSKPYCKKYLSKILSMNKKQYDHMADKKKDASSYVVWNLQNKDKLFLDLIFKTFFLWELIKMKKIAINSSCYTQEF